ncbi:MAG: MAPEG family protein [Alphaproteobacteria bacterium]
MEQAATQMAQAMAQMSNGIIPVSTLYIGLNALIMFILSALVVRARMQTGVEVGDGGREELIKAQRAHGNNVEYVPISLLILIAVELAGATVWLLHGLGGRIDGCAYCARDWHAYINGTFSRTCGWRFAFLACHAGRQYSLHLLRSELIPIYHRAGLWVRLVFRRQEYSCHQISPPHKNMMKPVYAIWPMMSLRGCVRQARTPPMC